MTQSLAMSMTPSAQHGSVSIRLIRTRDARRLERELADNRAWLSRWEATIPGGVTSFDMRLAARRLLQQNRDGLGYPFVIEYEGAVVGQLNVWGVARGSLQSATIGYWIAERFAGRDITPTAVALATDLSFRRFGLHRMEICMRPENVASMRVAQKLGFRYEGLRQNFIHIDGAWRDHLCFALTTEDVPEGVLARWVSGSIPTDAGAVPPEDLLPR
jgi:ribosomal-protein-alanine N-acetyltransferase